MRPNAQFSVDGAASPCLGGRADVDVAFWQPFLSCAMPTQWRFAVNSESTYDREDEQCPVPVNVNASKLMRYGSQLVNFGRCVRYCFDTPDGGAEGFGLRLTVSLLFPR